MPFRISFLLFLCLGTPSAFAQTPTTAAPADRARIVIGTSANSASVIAIPAETSWTGTISFGASRSTVMDPSNLQSWLETRRSENGLSSANLASWHIVITFDQFDGDGDNVHSGVFEEFWANSKRSKVNFRSDDMNQTDVISDDGLYRAGDQQWQSRIQSEVHTAVIDPFSSAAVLQGFRVTTMDRAFGEHTLRCDVFDRTSGGISSPNQYCFDSTDSALRYVRGPGWWQIGYNDVVSFAGHFVAREVDVTDGGHPRLKLRVTKLEQLDPGDNHFDLPAGSVKLSGQRISGVSVTPIKTVPIDASAVSQLPKFEVMVQIVIAKDGRVIEAKAISGPKEAYKAAETAARKWIFPPCLVAGEPTEVSTKISFSKY